jgi:homoserine kinase
MVRVKVPASTANFGPGFDSLGLAVSLYATLCFWEDEDGLKIEGCDDAYKTENNLAVVAYKKVLSRLSIPFQNLGVRIDSEIPVSRGLGSSAALIVAGLLAGNAAHGAKLSKSTLFSLATELEGHPDNVAAALFGGFTASMLQNGVPNMARYEIDPSLRFLALVPDFEISTQAARASLPKTVPLSDAVFNLSRMGVLLKALEYGDDPLIAAALDDKLHQPYRSKLIPGYETVRGFALNTGCTAFYISGSGSACMCVYRSESFPERMKGLIAGLPNNWHTIPLNIDHEGAVLLETAPCKTNF